LQEGTGCMLRKQCSVSSVSIFTTALYLNVYSYIVPDYHNLLLMLTVTHLTSTYFWALKQSNNKFTIHVDCSEVNKLRCELIQYQKPCTNQVRMTFAQPPITQCLMLIFVHPIFRLLLRKRRMLWPQASTQCKMLDFYSFIVYNP